MMLNIKCAFNRHKTHTSILHQQRAFSLYKHHQLIARCLADQVQQYIFNNSLSLVYRQVKLTLVNVLSKGCNISTHTKSPYSSTEVFFHLLVAGKLSNVVTLLYQMETEYNTCMVTV